MSNKLDGAMDVIPETHHVCRNCGCHNKREQMVHETLHSFCDFACRTAYRNRMAEKG